MLIATTGRKDVQGIVSLLNESRADLLTSQYLQGLAIDGRGEAAGGKIKDYIEALGDQWPSWSVSPRPFFCRWGGRCKSVFFVCFFCKLG